MNLAWLKFLALFAAVLSAAPAGTCCAPPKAAKAPEKRNCCHKAQQQGPATPSHPCRSVDRCCCQMDATKPELAKSLRFDDVVSLGSVAVPPVAAEVLSFGRPVVEWPPPGASRLHVLQCVWRC